MLPFLIKDNNDNNHYDNNNIMIVKVLWEIIVQCGNVVKVS